MCAIGTLSPNAGQRSRVYVTLLESGSDIRTVQELLGDANVSTTTRRERALESFFHSLKAELIHGQSFQTVTELRQQLRRYVQYYNHQRLHSSLGFRSPVDYERGAA
jgi:site-specific recombinase XerD